MQYLVKPLSTNKCILHVEEFWHLFLSCRSALQNILSHS